MTKTRTINLRVSEEEYNTLVENAYSYNLSTSAYILQCTLQPNQQMVYTPQTKYFLEYLTGFLIDNQTVLPKEARNTM